LADDPGFDGYHTMSESSERPVGAVVVQPGPPPYRYALPLEEEEAVSLSPIGLLNTLLRHRRLVVGAAFVTTVLATVLTVLLRGYRSESSFAPQTADAKASQLVGLAAQFGVNVGAFGGGESLDFYAAVLKSRAILTAVGTTEYAFPTDEEGRDTVRGTLTEIYEVSGETPEERLRATLKKLDRAVTVTKDLDAGIITVQVNAKWPVLAEQINARLLALVNDFNLSQRKTQAAAERHFVEGRLGPTRAELDSAEDALKAFYEANRTFENSPRLKVEAARLQRRVDLLQQVYLTLAQAHEQARIDEVRNTPVITVVDRPDGSTEPAGSLALNVVLAVAFGGVVGVGIAFARDYVGRQRVEQSDTYREFTQLRRAAVRDVLALPRRVLGIVRWRKS
jgi:uncharacterized protein involved in exopolysaccharide biosynthesis